MQMLFEQPDHCTRCGVAFEPGAERFMARENVCVELCTDGELFEPRITPVHQECLTDAERAWTGWHPFKCEGCGCPMKVSPGLKAAGWLQRSRCCSTRCDQERASPTCGACGSRFSPKRRDAQYCSGACRQAAFRSRIAGSTT
jgi:hypothetical protein